MSMVIPVFNDTRVYKAIESVTAQRDCDVELVIIDGGSGPETLAVIERYRDRIDLLVSEPDEGIFDAINKGIRRASGEIIGVLGADDGLPHPHVLARVRDELASHPELDGCYGDMVYVDEQDRVVRYWKGSTYKRYKLYLGWTICHFTLYLRSRVYDRCGLFDQTYSVSADYDFILRILSQYQVRLGYINELVLKMTLGGNSNRSLKNIFKGNRQSLASCRKQLGLCYFSLACKLMRKGLQHVAGKLYPPTLPRLEGVPPPPRARDH